MHLKIKISNQKSDKDNSFEIVDKIAYLDKTENLLSDLNKLEKKYSKNGFF